MMQDHFSQRMSCGHRWVQLLIGLALAGSASAHDVGLSTSTVAVEPDHVKVTLTFAVRDIEALVEMDSDHDGRVIPLELAAKQDQFNQRFATNCTVNCDGIAVEPQTTRCQIDETNNFVMQMDFPASEFRELVVRFDVIRELPPGHRMFVTVLGPAGETLAERLLSRDSPNIILVVDGPGSPKAEAAPQTFVDFLFMGIEHIGMGYDHLLFLFGLLIVTRSFKSSAIVITSFTLAHSITLAVATFGFFALKPSLTEPLIALSIVYVGVENMLMRGEPKARGFLTFTFGLIHGFGFASVLRDHGVGAHGSGVAMPLFSFNLGVELGQLAVAAIVLPIIWYVRKKEFFDRRFVPVCSIVVALAGGYWFVQRVRF